jgi:hypothetical protein
MKKTVAFVTSGLQFNGNTVYEKALGGSESAMIYMAKEMAKLGNEVTVYCECDKPGMYDLVEYRTLDQYFSDEKSQFDLLIVSRFTDFLALPIVNTKMNILWCHDIDCNNFKDAIGACDRVFCLSEYHKSLYVEKYKVSPANYIWKTSNGYDQTIVPKKVPFEQKKNNYIYASRPERGLKFLLERIWPEIINRNPDAVLHICGYTNNFNIPDHAKKLYDEIKKSDRNPISSENVVECLKQVLLGYSENSRHDPIEILKKILSDHKQFKIFNIKKKKKI